jgi:hypothetical protein
MGEGREALLVVVDGCYADAMTRAFEAAEESPEPFLAGIEAALEMAEQDPKGAHEVLWRLQADWNTLERLEAILGGEPKRAVLRLGAAIHVARAELSSPSPQPRRCLHEVLEWLYGGDRGAV